MKKLRLVELIASLLFFPGWTFAQSQPSSSTSPVAAQAPRRVQVDMDTASALVVQKAPLKYPDDARNAGIQGAVVLRVVTTYSGDVKEVTVVSGDAALAQAAAEAVKQWKYKPYLVDGAPTEMETQVSIRFHLKASPPPPPLGTFRDDAYSNDFFGIYYPLSRDWVRDTDLIRDKMTSEGSSQGSNLLLAAVHIPQDASPLRADSSFTVVAVNRSGDEDCRQYLGTAASSIQSQKEGKQKGETSQFTIAGHDFYRADFDYRQGIDHRTLVCVSIKDYIVQWNIVGWSKPAIETAVATLQSVKPAPPATMADPPVPTAAESDGAKHIRISSGVSTGLLIKKVTPVYPPEALHGRVQGSVVLRAAINKTGDIADLEVVSGPIELVVSAVNAVRKWKYRPYLFKGEPVEVDTQIVVNYALNWK